MNFSSIIQGLTPQSMFRWWDPLGPLPRDWLDEPLTPIDEPLVTNSTQFGESTHDPMKLWNAFQSNLSVALPDPQMTVGRPRRQLNERQRIQLLQNDEYVLSFTPTNVDCAGCGRTIQWDKENHLHYCPNFWIRHKLRCVGVALGMVSGLNSSPTKVCIDPICHVQTAVMRREIKARRDISE